MEIARQFNGEIIAADSRTIYKGMNIGTAKPSIDEQKEIPHHCLDLVEPGQKFTVADFKLHACSAIDNISDRGKLSILVGGTGLYVDSVLFDFKFSSQHDSSRRAALQELTDEELIKKVMDVGGLHVNIKNRRHMVRFLETGGTNKNDNTIRANTLVLGLKVGRNELRKRIEKRVEIMFKSGLRREVDGLVKRYGWESEALTGIGYREFRPYYDGVASMSEVKRAIAQVTLGRLAKHQRTWFKRNPHIEWFSSKREASRRAEDFLRRGPRVSQ